MRPVKADPSHCYHVFKLLRDFHKDAGLPSYTSEKYDYLLREVLDEDKEYILFLHGRRPVGLFWGEVLEDGKTFLIRGMYLRQKWRTFKFKRALAKERARIRKSFDTLQMMVPPLGRVPKRFRVLGTLVEEGGR